MDVKYRAKLHGKMAKVLFHVGRSRLQGGKKHNTQNIGICFLPMLFIEALWKFKIVDQNFLNEISDRTSSVNILP